MCVLSEQFESKGKVRNPGTVESNGKVRNPGTVESKGKVRNPGTVALLAVSPWASQEALMVKNPLPVQET